MPRTIGERGRERLPASPYQIRGTCPSKSTCTTSVAERGAPTDVARGSALRSSDLSIVANGIMFLSVIASLSVETLSDVVSTLTHPDCPKAYSCTHAVECRLTLSSISCGRLLSSRPRLFAVMLRLRRTQINSLPLKTCAPDCCMDLLGAACKTGTCTR